MAHQGGFTMKLHDMVASIRSKDDLATFVSALAQDVQSRPEDWENDTLFRFLSALSRWLTDSDVYYLDQGAPLPSDPTWKNIAEMLIAAKIYE
jgi:hypothetical protein